MLGEAGHGKGWNQRVAHSTRVRYAVWPGMARHGKAGPGWAWQGRNAQKKS